MTDWLPHDFAHPLRAQLTDQVHLRPIRASDVDLDLAVVLRNQPRLWAMYGEAWGWPPASLTRDEDAADLARHAAEMETHESFNYAVLNDDETELYGCVYIDPVTCGTLRAEVSWWCDADADPAIHRALDDFVPEWIATQWPFDQVSFPFN